MFSRFSFFILFLIITGCNDALVYSDYKATTNGAWNKDDVKKFEVSSLDSIQPYNVFIMVRNDNTFPFSNLFLIADIQTPDDQIIRDTLEYEMALPDGRWLGKGYGSVIENKLWYKENIVFSNPGVYTIQLVHAMRQTGQVEGLNNLKGITDVGIEIERREE
ncbi:MAG: gliding motility lipoprotein GldH [Flavobacteriaceae bacterium]